MHHFRATGGATAAPKERRRIRRTCPGQHGREGLIMASDYETLQRLALVIGLFLLISCTTNDVWQRPGADAATREQDLTACRQQAMRAEVASLGPLDEPLGSGPASLPLVTDRNGYTNGSMSAANVHEMFRRCLEIRGYRLRGAT
jgi:hypothetical protein